MPVILTSPWTTRILMFLMLTAVPIELGAMMESDHETHSLFAALSLVSTACYLALKTMAYIRERKSLHAQAE